MYLIMLGVFWGFFCIVTYFEIKFLKMQSKNTS